MTKKYEIYRINPNNDFEKLLYEYGVSGAMKRHEKIQAYITVADEGAEQWRGRWWKYYDHIATVICDNITRVQKVVKSPEMFRLVEEHITLNQPIDTLKKGDIVVDPKGIRWMYESEDKYNDV